MLGWLCGKKKNQNQDVMGNQDRIESGIKGSKISFENGKVKMGYDGVSLAGGGLGVKISFFNLPTTQQVAQVWQIYLQRYPFLLLR